MDQYTFEDRIQPIVDAAAETLTDEQMHAALDEAIEKARDELG